MLKMKQQMHLKVTKKQDKEIELGFVDGLFELYKLRCDIEKARSETVATKVRSGYCHRFGSFLFNSFICFLKMQYN